MKLARRGLFFILLFTSFSANSHNPEKLVISEIERGQLNFENEQIAAEYGAALKRQRITRLNAMSWFKKIYIFIKAGFEHIIKVLIINFCYCFSQAYLIIDNSS